MNFIEERKKRKHNMDTRDIHIFLRQHDPLLRWVVIGALIGWAGVIFTGVLMMIAGMNDMTLP